MELRQPDDQIIAVEVVVKEIPRTIRGSMQTR
jgi:hypothetical protein